MPDKNSLEPSPAFLPRFDWSQFNKDCRDGFRPCVIAGIRPWRKGSYRLELGEKEGIPIVHNYGHGGAGITMSWGCAEEVYNKLQGKYPPDKKRSIAVLGAGVIGLTTAGVLLEKGYPVKIYAKDVSPNTTSDIAGGQWSPSAVRHSDKGEFDRILINSHKKFSSLIGNGYGVVERPNYVHRPGGKLGESFESIPDGLVVKKKLVKLPFDCSFAHSGYGGWQVDTLLVEPTVFMQKLMSELKRNHGVSPEIKTFDKWSDVKRLPEKIIVNCTGFGSKGLFPDDEQLIGIKGQLILIPPQPKLDYLFSAGKRYVFPRSDAVVIGGTFKGSDTVVSKRDCEDFWRRNKRLFGAKTIFVREHFIFNFFEYVEENLTAIWRGDFYGQYSYEVDGETYTDL